MPSFTQPTTFRLALLFLVPPLSPAFPLHFLALTLAYFVLALPFEGSTAFILLPHWLSANSLFLAPASMVYSHWTCPSSPASEAALTPSLGLFLA